MDEASLKKVHETVMEKLKSACRLDLRATMDTIIKNKGNCPNDGSLRKCPSFENGSRQLGDEFVLDMFCSPSTKIFDKSGTGTGPVRKGKLLSFDSIPTEQHWEAEVDATVVLGIMLREKNIGQSVQDCDFEGASSRVCGP